MGRDLSHGVFLPIQVPSFINADPRQAHASALAGRTHMASDPRLPVLCLHVIFQRREGGAGAVVVRGFKEFGTSVMSKHRAEHGQWLDLSSNCSSGAT